MADDLDPERQPLWAGARRQSDAWAPRQGPDRIEAGAAGRAEPLGRLPGGARGQQDVDFTEEVVELPSDRFGRVERLDIGSERQVAAGAQDRVAKHLTDLVVVLLVFIGVVA